MSGAMLDRRHDPASGGAIRAELVGDHASGRTALLLQQAPEQTPCCFGIAPGLQDLVENIAIMVDGAPQPVLLAGDADHDLVEMPDVAKARALSPEPACVVRSELSGPAAHRLLGDNDAALQHFLDQAKAQGEAEIQPHRMRDDRGRKTMATIVHGRRGRAGPPTTYISSPALT